MPPFARRTAHLPRFCCCLPPRIVTCLPLRTHTHFYAHRFRFCLCLCQIPFLHARFTLTAFADCARACLLLLSRLVRTPPPHLPMPRCLPLRHAVTRPSGAYTCLALPPPPTDFTLLPHTAFYIYLPAVFAHYLVVRYAALNGPVWDARTHLWRVRCLFGSGWFLLPLLT